jgi:hypothetical protein
MQFHQNVGSSLHLGVLKATSSYALLLGTQLVPIMQAVPAVIDTEGTPYGVFEINPAYLSLEQIMALVRYLIDPEDETPRAIAEGVSIVLNGFDIPAHHFQAVTVSHGQPVNWTEGQDIPRVPLT